MVVVGLALAVVAALIHVFIFYLESIAWTGARARAAFGTTPEEAETTRFLAFNQGFYNLFLAILIAIGVILMAADRDTAGLTLVLAGTGSMVAAATVLGVASAPHRGAALTQGLAPLLATLILVIQAI